MESRACNKSSYDGLELMGLRYGRCTSCGRWIWGFYWRLVGLLAEASFRAFATHANRKMPPLYSATCSKGLWVCMAVGRIQGCRSAIIRVSTYRASRCRAWQGSTEPLLLCHPQSPGPRPLDQLHRHFRRSCNICKDVHIGESRSIFSTVLFVCLAGNVELSLAAYGETFPRVLKVNVFFLSAVEKSSTTTAQQRCALWARRKVPTSRDVTLGNSTLVVLTCMPDQDNSFCKHKRTASPSKQHCKSTPRESPKQTLRNASTYDCGAEVAGDAPCTRCCKILHTPVSPPKQTGPEEFYGLLAPAWRKMGARRTGVPTQCGLPVRTIS